MQICGSERADGWKIHPKKHNTTALRQGGDYCLLCDPALDSIFIWYGNSVHGLVFKQRAERFDFSGERHQDTAHLIRIISIVFRRIHSAAVMLPS